MDTSKEVEGGGDNNNKKKKQEKHESEELKGGDSIRKGRSCIGYHYFSSSLKFSNGKPRCIGLPRTLQQVPNEVIRDSEAKALEDDGRALLDFFYSCIGYSIYINVQDGVSTDNKQTKRIQLPTCIGFKLLWQLKAAPARSKEESLWIQLQSETISSDTASAPAPACSKEEKSQIQLQSAPISGDTASAPAPAPVHTCSKEERVRDTDRRRIDTRKEVKDGDNNNKKQEKQQSEAVRGDTIQKVKSAKEETTTTRKEAKEGGDNKNKNKKSSKAKR